MISDTLSTLRNTTAKRLMTARKRMQDHDPLSVFQAGGWSQTAWEAAFEANDDKTLRQYNAIHDALAKAAWKQREAVNV